MLVTDTERGSPMHHRDRIGQQGPYITQGPYAMHVLVPPSPERVFP